MLPLFFYGVLFMNEYKRLVNEYNRKPIMIF